MSVRRPRIDIVDLPDLRPYIYRGAGNPVGSIIGKSLKYWFDYGKSWHSDRMRQLDTIKMLEALKRQRGGKMRRTRGGKFELQDLRDGFMGPIGWIRMGLRKKRARQIERLKQELGLTDEDIQQRLLR